MIKQEFEDRVGIMISEACYEKLIEPEYMASELDKDTWCKCWKRNNGIQKVLLFERERARQAIETAKSYQSKISEYIKIIDNKNHIIFDLNKEVVALLKYKKLVGKILGIEKELANQIK